MSSNDDDEQQEACPYPLTEDMEAAYLATKGDRDSVGTPWQCTTCYIAQVLINTYSMPFEVTREYYTITDNGAPTTEEACSNPEWTLPYWAKARLDCFDHISPMYRNLDGQIEKCVWLRAWQAYQQRKGWIAS